MRRTFSYWEKGTESQLHKDTVVLQYDGQRCVAAVDFPLAYPLTVFFLIHSTTSIPKLSSLVKNGVAFHRAVKNVGKFCHRQAP